MSSQYKNFFRPSIAALMPSSGVAPLGPPDAQRLGTIHLLPARPHDRQVAHVVGVQVADKDLVEVIHRDLHGRDPAHGLRTDIEQELVTVAKLDQPAGRGLLGSYRRLAGATRNDANFVRAKRLRARVVNIHARQRLDGRKRLSNGGRPREQEDRNCQKHVTEYCWIAWLEEVKHSSSSWLS